MEEAPEPGGVSRPALRLQGEMKHQLFCRQEWCSGYVSETGIPFMQLLPIMVLGKVSWNRHKSEPNLSITHIGPQRVAIGLQIGGLPISCLREEIATLRRFSGRLKIVVWRVEARLRNAPGIELMASIFEPTIVADNIQMCCSFFVKLIDSVPELEKVSGSVLIKPCNEETLDDAFRLSD